MNDATQQYYYQIEELIWDHIYDNDLLQVAPYSSDQCKDYFYAALGDTADNFKHVGDYLSAVHLYDLVPNSFFVNAACAYALESIDWVRVSREIQEERVKKPFSA